jgi:hypothetical protein
MGPSNLSVILQLGKLSVSVIFLMTLASLVLGTEVFEVALLARYLPNTFASRNISKKKYLRSVNVELDLVYAKTV